MKKIAYTILLAMFSLLAFSQTSVREGLGWYAPTKYPKIPMETGAKSFSVFVYGAAPGIDNPFSAFDFASRGFTYTKNATAADIVVEFANIVIDQPIVIDGFDPQKNVTRKDDGAVRVRRGALHIAGNGGTETSYIPGRYKAYCKKSISFDMIIKVEGKIMYQDRMSVSRAFESEWYHNVNQAEDSLKLKLKALALKHAVAEANRVASQIVGDGYMIGGLMKYSCYMFRAGKKSGIGYNDINGAAEKMQNAFEYIHRNDWNYADFKERCEGIVETWENALKEQDLKNKKARINAEVACGLYYDIALYYMFIKEYDIAREYFEKVIAIIPKFGRARYLMDEMPKCQRAKERYEAMMKEVREKKSLQDSSQE